MSDVAAIIERLYRTWLYPPDARPAQCFLNGNITSGEPTMPLTNFVIPEDEELMANGVVVEVGSELMQVTSYDANTQIAGGLKRGFLGTTATTHAGDDPVYLSPPFSRFSVFEAVADNIITLYPGLFTVATIPVTSVGANIYPLPDELGVEVITAWAQGLHSADEVSAEIVDFHAAVGGRAVIANMVAGELWVKYRRRFKVATAESDMLVDLGVDPRWVNIIMAGAAADLYAGRDLPASHTEWVQAAIEAENIPVGTRTSLSRNLAAYRTHLLEQASKEMKAEYRGSSNRRPVQALRRSVW